MEKIEEKTDLTDRSSERNWAHNYDIPLEERDALEEIERLKKLNKIEKTLEEFNEKFHELTWEIKILTKFTAQHKIQHIQNKVKTDCKNCLAMEQELIKKEEELEVCKNNINRLEKANKILIDAWLTDKLTQLWNREAFNEHAKELILSWKKFSIAFIDIDHFKSINDTYWHACWDKVLKFLAKRLKLAGKVYRRWWEEFLIINECNEAELKNKLEHVKIWSLRQEYKLPEPHIGTIKISFSAWVIGYHPDSPLTITQLTRYADDLMYEAKHTRDTTVTFQESKKSH